MPKLTGLKEKLARKRKTVDEMFHLQSFFQTKYEPFLRNTQGSMRNGSVAGAGQPRIPPPRLNSRLSDPGAYTKNGYLIKKGL